MRIHNSFRFTLLIIIVVAISSCYRVNQTENYPEDWGSKVKSDQECPDISGIYSSESKDDDRGSTMLANWLLCSIDIRKNLKIPDHTDVEIVQSFPEEINIKLLKNSNTLSEFQILRNNDHFSCTDNNEIKLVCKKEDDIYLSGNYKSRAFISKNSEQFLVLNTRSSGVGVLLKAIPTSISKSKYYRYESTTQREATE